MGHHGVGCKGESLVVVVTSTQFARLALPCPFLITTKAAALEVHAAWPSYSNVRVTQKLLLPWKPGPHLDFTYALEAGPHVHLTRGSSTKGRQPLASVLFGVMASFFLDEAGGEDSPAVESPAVEPRTPMKDRMMSGIQLSTLSTKKTRGKDTVKRAARGTKQTFAGRRPPKSGELSTSYFLIKDGYSDYKARFPKTKLSQEHAWHFMKRKLAEIAAAAKKQAGDMSVQVCSPAATVEAAYAELALKEKD